MSKIENPKTSSGSQQGCMAQRALLLFQSYQGFGEWSPDIAAPTKRRGAGEITAQVNSVRNVKSGYANS
jgi:hypothetical protein